MSGIRGAGKVGWRRAVAAVLVVAALGSGVLWWRGRPRRHLAWAEAALNDGDPDEAMEWLAVPEAAPATRERALLLRARVAVERGRPTAAAWALDGIDPHGPCAADLAFWKGRTLYAARQPLLAMDWFRRALADRPDDADAHRWLAAAAYDLGDRSTAVSALEAVARIDPKDARVWRTLGMISKENVEYERARDAFERSLTLDRSQPEVRLELAEVLVRLGDAVGARAQLEACRGRVPEANRADLLGECCRLSGDREGQRAAVDAGLADAPDHPGLLTQRARIDLADGRPDDALRRLDRAVAADPFRSETIYLRGLVLGQLGRDPEARRDRERAAALNRLTAEMSGLNDRAARDPRDADVRYRLGQLCVELGKADLAASWFRAALACDPRHRNARLALAALRRGAAPSPVGGR